jgi:hypothetical protein
MQKGDRSGVDETPIEAAVRPQCQGGLRNCEQLNASIRKKLREKIAIPGVRDRAML